MFIDQAVIKIESGQGGNGAVAWRREKHVPLGGPAGGNGGNGGDVIIQATDQLSSLLDFTYKTYFKADNGDHGRTKNQHGKNGKDLIISVPIGTIVKDQETGQAIIDLNEKGASVIIAKGGKGGYGNSHFVTPTRQAPSYCEPGEPAIKKVLSLELKLIADVGIIGKPNAGKSTFISTVSAAKPKIADYPFTTLEPNLGVVKDSYNRTIVVADIPGLIEGASKGIGLGHEFLRHVERCKLLLHLVDITADNPIQDYETIMMELKAYSQILAEKQQIIALTKIDAVPEDDSTFFMDELKKVSTQQTIYPISSISNAGIADLVNLLVQKAHTIEIPELNLNFIDAENYASTQEKDELILQKEDGIYFVESKKIRRLATITNFNDHESLFRFENTLRQMAVFQQLEEMGIQDGDTVVAGGFEFEYFADDRDHLDDFTQGDKTLPDD